VRDRAACFAGALVRPTQTLRQGRVKARRRGERAGRKRQGGGLRWRQRGTASRGEDAEGPAPEETVSNHGANGNKGHERSGAERYRQPGTPEPRRRGECPGGERAHTSVCGNGLRLSAHPEGGENAMRGATGDEPEACGRRGSPCREHGTISLLTDGRATSEVVNRGGGRQRLRRSRGTRNRKAGNTTAVDSALRGAGSTPRSGDTLQVSEVGGQAQSGKSASGAKAMSGREARRRGARLRGRHRGGGEAQEGIGPRRWQQRGGNGLRLRRSPEGALSPGKDAQASASGGG
jgi:hypothetical protein